MAVTKTKLSAVSTEATTIGATDRFYIVQGGVTKFITGSTLAAQLGVSSAGDTFDIAFHADAGANLTLTDQAQAAAFLSNSNRNVKQVDLTNAAQCRLQVRVITGSTSANTPRLRVRYKTGGYSATITDYLEIGESEISCSIATSATLVVSSWIDMVEGALTDVQLIVDQIGGDADKDPVIASVHVQFK